MLIITCRRRWRIKDCCVDLFAQTLIVSGKKLHFAWEFSNETATFWLTTSLVTVNFLNIINRIAVQQRSICDRSYVCVDIVNVYSTREYLKWNINDDKLKCCATMVLMVSSQKKPSLEVNTRSIFSLLSVIIVNVYDVPCWWFTVNIRKHRSIYSSKHYSVHFESMTIQSCTTMGGGGTKLKRSYGRNGSISQRLICQMSRETNMITGDVKLGIKWRKVQNLMSR